MVYSKWQEDISSKDTADFLNIYEVIPNSERSANVTQR
jgi:hypothetical protein